MTKRNLRDRIKIIILKLTMISGAKNDNELATILNTNQNSFSSWKNTTKIIPIENLIDFCSKYNISLDWLLRDEEIQKDFNKNSNFIQIPYFDKINTNTFFKNNLNNIATNFIYINPNMIPINEINQELFALNIKDEQLLDYAPVGSTLIMSKSDQEVRDFPQRYLIQIDKEVMFRNMYKNIVGQYVLISEFKYVDDIKINKENITILGKVKGVLKWKN